MSTSTVNLYQHGRGSNPSELYSETDNTAKEKVLNNLIIKGLVSGWKRVFASSLYMAEDCGFIPRGFQEQYYKDKKLKQLTTEQILMKRYAERKINKIVHELKNEFGFIDTETTHRNYHGSRREITLNNDLIEKLYSEFNPNITEWEFNGKLLTLDKNRGFIIVIRKFIRNRIFSLVSAVKEKREQFNKFIKYQADRNKLNGLIAFGEENEESAEIIEMLEIDFERRLNKQELNTVRKTHFTFDQWKSGLHKALINKKLSIKYIKTTIENELKPKKDMSYFDQFINDTSQA